MKLQRAVLLLSISVLPFSAWAKKSAEFPVTYSGGSLPFHHNKILATLGQNEVILMQHGQRIAIPASSITEISYRTAHHYVGVEWSSAAGQTEKAEVLLKLSRGEYREFLAALEQITGIKAIDTNQVPTVVRYRS